MFLEPPNFWLDPKVAKDQGRRPLGYSIIFSAKSLETRFAQTAILLFRYETPFDLPPVCLGQGVGLLAQVEDSMAQPYAES